MTVAANSLDAYKTVSLTENEAKVLAVYKAGDELRDEDVAERLGWGIQSVTGRVQSLIAHKKLDLCARGKTKAGNTCRVTRLADPSKPAEARYHCERCDDRKNNTIQIKCGRCCRDWICSIPEESRASAIERIRIGGGPADKLAAYLVEAGKMAA